jgi:CHASE3 domain sensor protein
MPGFPRTIRQTPMDIESINAIGTLLNDLQERTAALRGYL